MRRAGRGCVTGAPPFLHGSFMAVSRSPWLQAVARAVKAIPRGQTASYARVALMAGKPGAARAVVRALHALDDIPWWRVIKADGTLAPQVATRQAAKLKREGVQIVGRRVVTARFSSGKIDRALP